MNDSVHDASEFSDSDLRALLQRVARRDKAAFRTLYGALYPKLSRYLLRILRRIDDVDDLINEVMWVVWCKADEFRGDAQVTTWILAIATFKSYRWQRQWQRQQLIFNQTLTDAEPAIDTNTDELLEYGMAHLSQDHREALELAYLYGYSCEEIAVIKECPIGTVKTRLHHARKRLRQLLAPIKPTLGEVS